MKMGTNSTGCTEWERDFDPVTEQLAGDTMASRIVPHPEAFAVGGRGKRNPREHKQSHLDFIAKLPCMVCGRRIGIVAAHLRAGDPTVGKRETGGGEKPSDHWALPLCSRHHAIQHTENELLFWEGIGLSDPFRVALALWAMTGNVEDAETMIRLLQQGERF